MSLPNGGYFPNYPTLGAPAAYGAASGSSTMGAAPAQANGMKRPADDQVTREAWEKKQRLEASMLAQPNMLGGPSAGFAPQQFQLPEGSAPAFPSALPSRFAHGPPRQLQAAPMPPSSNYQPSPGPSRSMTPIPQPQLVPRPPPSQPPQQQLQQPQPPFEIPPVGSTAEREYRRAVFLAHFRNDYFQPLLPPGRNYFSSHPPPGGTLLHYKPAAQPQAIQGTMKSYQLAGLSFLAWMHANGANAILGDEMGLGKTLQTLSLLAWVHETRGIKGPHLIVCPLSVLSSWLTEAARWLPSFKTKRMHGSVNERSRLKAELRDNPVDIVITTYDCFLAEADAMKRMGKWQYLVLDEGHKIKNVKSNISQALFGVGAAHRLLLTGTPLQNNLGELWALLHWLYPMVFTETTQSQFENAFDLGQGRVQSNFLGHAQKLLQLLMLRRTKEGVADQLSVPPRREHTLYVPLSPLQRFWYERLLTKTDKVTLGTVFNAGGSSTSSAGPSTPDPDAIETIKRAAKKVDVADRGKNSNWQKLQNLLMQLRKVCIHPYLISEAEPDPYEIGEHVVLGSAKFVLLDKLLEKMLAEKRQTLVFSGFTRTLDTLENMMRLRGIKYGRLDGSTSRPRRALDMRLFQQGSYDVYMISTRAGGLGINLTAATCVILLDQDFNPQVTLQAIARAHRIGQTKIVDVFSIICQSSVEDQMMTRINKKKYLATKIMGTGAGMHAGQQLPGGPPVTTTANGAGGKDQQRKGRAPEAETEVLALNANELRDILRGGSGALALRWSDDGEEGGMTAYDQFAATGIDDLLAHSKQLADRRDAKLEVEIGVARGADKAALAQAAAAEEKRLLQGIERVETRLWEGKLHATKPKSNVEIASEWQEMTKRVRVERTVQIDGMAVSAESLGCAQWQAVKTITGNASNAEQVRSAGRKRVVFEHQDYCLYCYEGGTVYTCRSCPRIMHADEACTGISNKQMAEQIGGFFCPQHRCFECGRTTNDAGGLLFRCQTCVKAYCEDCLPSSGWEPVGETLPEFLLLGFGAVAQAYFIRCPTCLEIWELEPETKASFDKEQARILGELDARAAAA